MVTLTIAKHWNNCAAYITRPALVNERVQCNAAGRVVLKLKSPGRDGSTHLVMSPLENMKQAIERPVYGGQIHWF